MRRARKAGPWVLAALLAAMAPAPALAEGAEVDARAHFGKGVELVEQRAWAEALAEFLLSRKLHPTWKATKNAAACLSELGRYDEALDLLEALVREFPDLPPPAREDVAAASARLAERVGTIAVEGGEDGASVVVDERYRGELPVAASLRVVTGNHVVRITRDGFEPFEARVVVLPGQRARVEGKLRALVGAGRLLVAEEKGRAVDVVVDGRVVGRAPWEGTLPAGDHLVWLRGADDLGTQPRVVRVEPRARVTALLEAEPLRALVKLTVEPDNATLAIDGVPLGTGAWEGRLRAGDHRIEAAAEGFVRGRRDVRLGTGASALRVPLERDELAGVWRRSPRVTIEIDAGALIAPGLGGDVSRGCTGGCIARPAIGGRALLRVGLEYRSGLSFGLAGGGLAANQTTTGRSAVLLPIGLAPTPGEVHDTRKLRAFVGGAWGAFTLGERRFLRFRLGGGAVVGALGDSRTGRFTQVGAEAASYTIGPVGDAPRAAFAFVEPEVRAGLRVTRGLELSVGMSALWLFDLANPVWDAKHVVNASRDGIARFAEESLVSPVVPAIVPGIAIRYEL